MEQNVKGVIFSSTQQQLVAMRESGEIQVAEGDEPDCLIEKINLADWYPLAKLSAWSRQIRDLVGVNRLFDFGWACADRVGKMGVYRQFEVTAEEQGFSLGLKLVLTFANVSHPYTKWSYEQADEKWGAVFDVVGSADWNDEQSEITRGWVAFLMGKLFRRKLRSSWERTGSGDVRYRVEVV